MGEFRVHLENREPPRPIRIAGRLIATHVVPESPPLMIVDSANEAKAAILELIATGVPPGELYAVGHDGYALPLERMRPYQR